MPVENSRDRKENFCIVHILMNMENALIWKYIYLTAYGALMCKTVHPDMLTIVIVRNKLSITIDQTNY